MIFHLPNFKHSASGGVVISGESEVKVEVEVEPKTRKQYTRYPPHVKERCIELAREGMPQREITKLLGLPCATVSLWLCELGLSTHCKLLEKRERLKELAPGRTNVELARLLGIHRDSVRRYLNNAGLKSMRCPRKFTPEVVEKIRLLAEQGYSQTEIAAFIGSAQSSISKVMRDHKIKPGVRNLQPVKTWASVSVEIK